MIWKTFAGRCIHRGLNGVRVKQNIRYRWLTFDSDAIQTLIHRHHPETAGLQYIQAFTLAARANPAPSCLLGLGGAGVAHTLAPYFKNIPLDAVESSLEVIDIGSQYFMIESIKNLRIIHQDAFLYVQNTENRYQHLLIDISGAHEFPAHCNSLDFFAHAHRILLPNGILAINLANPHEHWPILSHIRNHFQHCTVSIPIKGTANMVILAYKDESIKPLLSLFERQTGLKQLIWDSEWGYVARLGNLPSTL